LHPVASETDTVLFFVASVVCGDIKLFVDCGKDLFDDFWMQDFAGMKGNYNPNALSEIDPVASLASNHLKAAL
jgi:hypothetical protein